MAYSTGTGSNSAIVSRGDGRRCQRLQKTWSLFVKCKDDVEARWLQRRSRSVCAKPNLLCATCLPQQIQLSGLSTPGETSRCRIYFPPERYPHEAAESECGYDSLVDQDIRQLRRVPTASRNYTTIFIRSICRPFAINLLSIPVCVIA